MVMFCNIVTQFNDFRWTIVCTLFFLQSTHFSTLTFLSMLFHFFFNLLLFRNLHFFCSWKTPSLEFKLWKCVEIYISTHFINTLRIKKLKYSPVKALNFVIPFEAISFNSTSTWAVGKLLIARQTGQRSSTTVVAYAIKNYNTHMVWVDCVSLHYMSFCIISFSFISMSSNLKRELWWEWITDSWTGPT